ncbi:hypothetical protein HZA86_03430 [Candidatus Uhrbacteria bacterium]|nr:hypothetical protein [Candidatus Uhrbacteria bacterium]
MQRLENAIVRPILSGIAMGLIVGFVLMIRIPVPTPQTLPATSVVSRAQAAGRLQAAEAIVPLVQRLRTKWDGSDEEADKIIQDAQQLLQRARDAFTRSDYDTVFSDATASIIQAEHARLRLEQLQLDE